MVKLLPKKPKQDKRRLAKSRPSLFARSSKKQATKMAAKSWRAKQHHLWIGPHKTLVITRRKFRTKVDKRSKAYKQSVLLINNYPFPVREIAFRIKWHSRRAKPAPRSYSIFRLQFALPAFFIIIGIAGTLFFSLQAAQGRNIESPDTFSVAPTPTADIAPVVDNKPKGLAKSEPTRIRIARLGIDYNTIPVGKLGDGSMETPNPLHSVTGWYKYSPTPGEIGPSVIVGHVDNLKGPSVFWRLRELLAGDIVEVTRADGSTVKFKVESLKQFEQANFPTAEVYGNTQDAALRLITCGGKFNRTTGNYTENTVVYASVLEG